MTNKRIISADKINETAFFLIPNKNFFSELPYFGIHNNFKKLFYYGVVLSKNFFWSNFIQSKDIVIV